MKKAKYLMLLHLIVLFYSLGSICSKFASRLPFFSFKWCALYGLNILILGIYAIMWQQILKNMPLNLAYANKSMTLLWGMLFGFLIFKEDISFKNIIGAVIVLIGVIIMVLAPASSKRETLEKDGAVSSQAEKGGDGDE